MPFSVLIEHLIPDSSFSCLQITFSSSVWEFYKINEQKFEGNRVARFRFWKRLFLKKLEEEEVLSEFSSSYERAE